MARKLIITHDGTFHLDEILAIAILQHIFADTEVLRTRDYALIADRLQTGAVLAVVDVYGRHDGEIFFDHHQKGFNYKLKVLCSSAGLIFDKFRTRLFHGKPSYLAERLAVEVYEKYVMYVDALDNGIDVESFIVGDGRTRVAVRSLFSMVADCGSFEEASALVKADFANFMRGLDQWAVKYEQVYECVRRMEAGEKILYTKGLRNVGKIVCEVEKELGRDVKFVVDAGEPNFYVYAVPECVDSFRCKEPLKAEWRSLRDKELSAVSGIDGCVYVHATGFLGINETLEGAVEMCEKTLQLKNLI